MTALRILLVSLLGGIAPLSAQVRTFGDSGQDQVFSITHDDDDNVFYSGIFSGTVDFDPSDGPDAGDTFTTAPDATDGFVASFTPAGALRFVFPLSGNNFTAPTGIAVAPTGEVFIAGLFASTVDFDPGPGVVNPTGGATFNLFVASYTNTGELRFANAMGGSGLLGASDLDIDAAGNIYVSGFIGGTHDFDPSASTAELSSPGSTGGFVASYSHAGTYRFTTLLVGDDQLDINGIAVDPAGNSFVCGEFTGTADLDDSDGADGDDSITSAGFQDCFVASFSPAGTYRFGFGFGSPLSDSASGVAVDGEGDFYVTGDAERGIDFDPGPDMVDPLGASGGFYLASYTNAGAYRFVVGEGPETGSGEGIGYAVVAKDDAVFVTGTFKGLVDLAPGSPDGRGVIASVGGTAFVESDVFVARYQSDGTGVWARSYDTQRPSPSGISALESGAVAVAGSFEGTADFDPGIEMESRTSAGGEDGFVLQLGADGTLPGSPTPSFLVTNTNDAGAGSLRRALEFANNTGAHDTITFDIPGAGPHTITPLAPLPQIQFPLDLDGLSQPDASAATWPPDLQIVLDGSAAGAGGDGISVGATDSLSERFYGSTNIRGIVVQNFANYGVNLNLLSRGVTVADCFLGTTASGLASAPNAAGGVFVRTGGSAHSAPSAIHIGAPTGNTTGRNLISGNGGPAIHVQSSKGSVIQNNAIGMDASGAALANSGAGIFVSGASDNALSVFALEIGGPTAGAANRIAFNAGAGVAIGDATQIEVLGNSIYNNGGLGIDFFFPDNNTPGLGTPEVNDFADDDLYSGGANRGMNYPILESALLHAGKTVVTGTLDAIAGPPLRVEFFSSPTADPSGYGEGEVYLGMILTDTNKGIASFVATLPPVLPGHVISATATVRSDVSMGEGTSEFSPVVIVMEPAVTNLADSGAGSLRSAITAANASGGSDTIYLSPALASRTLVPATALPPISGDTHIIAPPGFTISGEGARRVLTIDAPGATVTLSGITFAHGSASQGGGILHSGGTLELRRCVVRDCESTSDGGGIAITGGTLDIEDTRITNNTAGGNGGGIARLAGTLNGDRVTIDGNTATNFGGGAYSAPRAIGTTTSFRATTFSGNLASTGGGFHSVMGDRPSRLDFCTVAANSATTEGGGIGGGDGTDGSGGGSRLDNCIIALNGAPLDPDIGNITLSDNTFGGDPKLGPLRDNGGFVPTHALLTDSPARDATGIPPFGAAAGTSDARLAPRINRSGSKVDHGAFEYFTGPYNAFPRNFSSWATQTLPVGQRGEDDDPNRDGISNLLAHFFGVPPLLGSTGDVGVRGEFLPAGDFLLSYSSPFSVLETLATSEIGSDLAGPTPGPEPVEVGSTTSRKFYEVTIPPAPPTLFLRLKLQSKP